MIAVFKGEKKEPKFDKLLANNNEHNHSSLIDTYMIVFKILNIPSMKLLAIILLTVKVAWSYSYALSLLKFLDAGVSNEVMIPLNALLGLPLQTMILMVVAKYSAVPSPTKLYIAAIPFRSFFCFMSVVIVWMTPRTIPADGVAPMYIYYVFLGNNVMTGFCWSVMYITMTALFTKISDPAVGGTYMTILNTIDNMGGSWTNTLSLWMVEYLTWRDCGKGSMSVSDFVAGQNVTEVC